MSKLVLGYEFDRSHFDKNLPPDDFGWLSLAVTTKDFTGKGGFWVQWQDIVEFGKRLDAYPIKKNSQIEAQWGYDTQEGDDRILHICLSPKGPLGDLLASVEIADPHNQSQRLNAAFRTTYAALDIFRSDIEKLMSGDCEEATLHGV